MIDDASALAARERQASLTKPAGSLGLLEELAIALAGMQGVARPQARPAAALLFAADHPVALHGVSAYPPEVTAQMVANFAAGGAAASVLCRELGVSLEVIDVGVAGRAAGPRSEAVRVLRDPVADELEGDLAEAPAMTAPVLARAVAAGVAAVERLPAQTKVLVLGEMGIGNSTCAAAVALALLGGDPAELVGPGTGVGAERLAHKRAIVTRAAARAAGGDGAEALRCCGGRELAAIAGAVGRAAERRMAILVDGFIVSAAVLALTRACPAVRPYLLFAHRSAEPGHRRILQALEARPLLELELRLGEGSGALAAYPLVQLACALHEQMATFASAQVTGAVAKP